jgi:hypothetical protein
VKQSLNDLLEDKSPSFIPQEELLEEEEEDE